MSFTKTALQEHVTWDRCGGPGAGAPGLFHIPLTDHGCKLTQVQNSSRSFYLFIYLTLTAKKVFQELNGARPTPAGRRQECVLSSLSSLLNGPI